MVLADILTAAHVGSGVLLSSWPSYRIEEPRFGSCLL